VARAPCRAPARRRSAPGAGADMHRLSVVPWCGGRAACAAGGHRAQAFDPLLGRGVGREQAADAAAVQRIHDEQVCLRRVLLGMRAAPASIFCRAEASHSGCPEISAPPRSASYSRERLIANCTSMAATGASTAISRPPSMPGPFSRLPPNMLENIAILASIEI